MTSGLKTLIYPVKDLARAKALFGALLGAEPTVDSPYYVQFEIGDQRLGLDPIGHTRASPAPSATGRSRTSTPASRSSSPPAPPSTKAPRTSATAP